MSKTSSPSSLSTHHLSSSDFLDDVDVGDDDDDGDDVDLKIISDSSPASFENSLSLVFVATRAGMAQGEPVGPGPKLSQY